MISSIGMDLVRSICSAADRITYTLIGILYNLIEDLATHQLMEQSTIENISNKLYSFIAIFMLFKISFSLINYIINPEAITDKEKGGSKLIINILISFGLIIFTPIGFSLLYEAQTAILEEKLVSGLFLSDTVSENRLYISSLCEEYGYSPVTLSRNNKADTGAYISMITLRPFVQVDETALNVRGEETVEKFLDNGYCDAESVKELLQTSIVNFDDSNSKKLYIMDYGVIISTIVGIIVFLIFTVFCLDTAVRTIKLYFLQIIAPIPIISYIDPKSSKNGIFNKWLKEVGVTWLDLFLRLAAVYFAVFIISSLDVSLDIQVSYGGLLNLLILLGALLFAKKLPDILKKMFNIDLKGNFTLNPLKKLEKEALGGKQITGAATGLASGTLGMATSFRGNNFKERFENAGKAFTSGLKGGYKSPNSLKGLGAGMKPYREMRKKEKDAQKEADRKLRKYDEFNQKGRDLIKDILKTDEDGNYILDEKGNYQIDEEKRANLFKDNQEYLDSYNRVNKAKTNLKNAKNEYQEAKSNLERLNSNPNTTQEQLNAALKNVNAKRESVDKAQGALDGAKERHKIIQQKYTKDTEIESAVKEYLDRTPDRTLDSLGINTNNVKIQATSSQSQGGDTSSPAQSANENHYNNDSNHQKYSKIEDEIKRAEEEKRKKLQEYSKETDIAKRNDISSDISKYEEQISVLKNEREDLNNEHPEVAADYIEDVVLPGKNSEMEQLQKEVDALYNTFNNPDESIKNYGVDYASNIDYQKAKASYDLKQEEIKAKRSDIYSLEKRVRKFRKQAENNISNAEQTVEQLFETENDNFNNNDFVNNSNNSSEEQEKLNKQKRKEYLSSELDKYHKEESEIKKHYGVPAYSKTREYQAIEAKIKEIEDELYYL